MRNWVSYVKFTVDIAYVCMLDIVHSYVFIFGNSILWVTFLTIDRTVIPTFSYTVIAYLCKTTLTVNVS